MLFILQCSVECGVGQISRSVDCMNTADDVVDDARCSGYKPDNSRSCDMGTCAKGWFQTAWSTEVGGLVFLNPFPQIDAF